MAMTNFVKLNQEDLKKFAEIMIMVVEWKAHALSPKSFETFKNNWLPSFLQQLRDNEWRVNRSHSNVFVWMEDQIRHSRRLASGVDPKNAVHLDDTKIGREVIAICRAAAKGQLFYNDSRRNSEFNNLFQ
jgi:hypothetical protein